MVKKKEEGFLINGPMTKKKWTDKVKGLQKLLNVAKFNRQKSKDDIEELTFMIESFNSKIKTFK